MSARTAKGMDGMAVNVDVPERGRPSLWARRATWFVVIACIGLGLGVGAVVALRAVDKPPALIGTMRLAQINLVGTLAGSPDGVVFTIEGSELHNQQPIQVVLLAQGDPSSPQLVCQYPDGPGACTFTKTTP